MADQPPRILYLLGILVAGGVAVLAVMRPDWFWSRRVVVWYRGLAGDLAAMAILLGFAAGLAATCLWKLLRR